MTRRPLPVVVPATWLRVYEPAAAYPGDQRRRWAAYLAAGERAIDRIDLIDQPIDQVEVALAWRRLVAGTDAPEPATARVIRRDGQALVCPVPPGDRALVQAWRLPVAWLALVRQEDRLPGAAGRYAVSMAVCRERSASALRTLLGALGESAVAERVAGTAQWLEGFDRRSWVEVDARSVVSLVDGDGADDVRLGLEALDHGDGTTVAAAYRRIRRREIELDELSRSS